MSTSYVRAPRQNQHVVITPSSTVRDGNISYRALGVLQRLLSNADGYGQTAEDLSAGAGREGRDAIRTALRELTTSGYIQRDPDTDSDGRFVGQTVYVYDTPQPPRKKSRRHRKPENPRADFPPAEKPVRKSSKSVRERVSSSSTRTRTRVAAPPAAAAHSGKQYSRRPSGIECWESGDADSAARIEGEQPADEITTAVAALLAAGKSPVAGAVLAEIRRRRRDRAAEAARAAAPAVTYDPAAAFAAAQAAATATATDTTTASTEDETP